MTDSFTALPAGYCEPNEHCLVSVDHDLKPSNELGYFGVNSRLMW